jgi:amidase
LAQWAETFRIVQASEIWAEHGQWAEKHLTEFGPGIKDRFEIAKSLDPNLIKAACATKNKIEQYIRGLLSDLSEDAPLGISVIANHGKDSLLLSAIQNLKIS